MGVLLLTFSKKLPGTFAGLCFTSTQTSTKAIRKFSLKWFTSNFESPLVNIHKLKYTPCWWAIS